MIGIELMMACAPSKPLCGLHCPPTTQAISLTVLAMATLPNMALVALSSWSESQRSTLTRQTQP